MTSVWSQPFGGNPLGLEDALVLLDFTTYLSFLFFLSLPALCRSAALRPATKKAPSDRLAVQL